MTPHAVTPAGLAERVARAAALSMAGQRSRGGVARSGIRIGIDGPVVADTRNLASAITAQVAGDGTPTVSVHAEDFVRARSLRLEYGVDGDAYYERWYDHAALRREVLDPLGPGGSLRYLPRLRDPVTDRPYRDPAIDAAPGTVLVVDGRFLGTWELSDAFDVLVFLDVSTAARARRLPGPEQGPVSEGWQRYLDECDPSARAQLVVRFDHPDRPAVVVPGG